MRNKFTKQAQAALTSGKGRSQLILNWAILAQNIFCWAFSVKQRELQAG